MKSLLSSTWMNKKGQTESAKAELKASHTEITWKMEKINRINRGNVAEREKHDDEYDDKYDIWNLDSR